MTPLTPREHQVLALICDGHSNAEIARRLGTSPHTVKNQVHLLLIKLGVNSRYRAAAMARGTIKPIEECA